MGALMPPPAIRGRMGIGETADLLATAVVGSLFAEAFVPPNSVADQTGAERRFSRAPQGLRRAFSGENLDTLLGPKSARKGQD